MKKKTTQTNQVAWSNPPATTATTNLQNMVDEGADYATPIRNSYARADQENKRSYNNPLGAFTTADVRDKSQRAQSANFQQSMGIDLANAAQAGSDAKFGRQATVAGFTAPRMYNSASQGTQSDPFGQAMQIGQMISSTASAALLG